MKKYISIALVFLAAACNTIEQPQTDSSDAVIYIQATGEENLTKGSVDGDDATFTWNTGDRIAVYTTSGYVISRALSSADDGEASANFPFSSSGNYALVQADREDFAIFPASLVWDGNAIRTSSATNHDAANLTLTLPARYELSQVQNNVSPTPMIASNTPNTALEFKALCPLLRLTVNNIPKQTKRIEFDFNGKKVQGEFTLTGIDMSAPVNYPAIETTAASDDNDIITVTMAGNTTWHDNLVINLPVPAGTYGDITITAYDAVSDGHSVLKLTKALKAGGLAWAPTRASSSKMTATLPVFTAANGKKVTFASGNVQAVFATAGSTCTWKFADHQYDYVGAEDANNSVIAGEVSSAGTVDLFGWVGENSEFIGLALYGIHNSSTVSDYGNTINEDLMHDWGELFGDGWRTPSFDDYKVILESRSASTISNINIFDTIVSTENGHYAKGYLMGTTHGVYVFPDNYEHPVSNTLAGVNSDNIKFWDMNQFEEDEWKKMEAAGVIFLPSAGYRVGTPDGDAKDVVLGAGSSGYYWTSTSSDSSKDLAFTGAYFGPTAMQVSRYQMRRWLGASVRLIRDLN